MNQRNSPLRFLAPFCVHVFGSFSLGSLYFNVFLRIHRGLKRTTQPTAFIPLCQDYAGICLLHLYPQETTEGAYEQVTFQLSDQL